MAGDAVTDLPETVSWKDPNLKRVQGRELRKGMVILKDAVPKEIIEVGRYKRFKRHWVAVGFDDGTNLAVPADHYVMQYTVQGELSGIAG